MVQDWYGGKMICPKCKVEFILAEPKDQRGLAPSGKCEACGETWILFWTMDESKDELLPLSGFIELK